LAGDVVNDSPDPEVVDGFLAQQPDGRAYAQIPVAWDENHATALDAARTATVAGGAGTARRRRG